MPYDWRSLLDQARIPWRVKGPNTSKGNVSIECPFCGDDPSFHFQLSETFDGYRCLRDSRHNGSHMVRLLVALGYSRTEAQVLLHEHKLDKKPLPPKPRAIEDLTDIWQRFPPAEDAPHSMRYLKGRGFTNPMQTAIDYDLRYARAGDWAQRVLIPFAVDGIVVSWAGRATTSYLRPRYRMYDPSPPGLIYVPRVITTEQTVVIVEGQFDALKIAVATERDSVGVIGLSGKNLDSADRLLRLAHVLGKSRRLILLALDPDVSVGVASHSIMLVAQALRWCYVARLHVPVGQEDPGAMSLGDAQKWIQNAIRANARVFMSGRSGQAHSRNTPASTRA
jgi:hypothetical protein